ncbi:NBAS isoform 7, partial [Pan troglodytes]
VDIADIENEENRYCLFMELLESSHHEAEFQHLVLLLQAWPPMKSEYVITNNPWVRLATVMLTRCTMENKEGLGNEVLKMCRSLYNTKQMLPAEVNDSNCDQELLSLLLDAKLLVKCVSTPFYPHIVDHLSASLQQGRWDAEELGRHLREAGHEAEAGSLLLAVRRTHRAFRTFSTALRAAQHWV